MTLKCTCCCQNYELDYTVMTFRYKEVISYNEFLRKNTKVGQINFIHHPVCPMCDSVSADMKDKHNVKFNEGFELILS